jgi:SNF2 family DNA or RNA helicase
LRFRPHNYQRQAIAWLLARKHGALFADPGLGKTAIALSVVNGLKILDPSNKVLIVAPLRPLLSTWPDELSKWAHTKGLRFQVLRGRSAGIDLSNDVFLANPENLDKFFAQKQCREIMTLIIDESSKFKNWSAKRTKLVKRNLKQFDRRYIMTGTPAPNSLLDLFAQIFLVDGGQCLGKAYTHFRAEFFRPTDPKGYTWKIRRFAAERIHKRIAPICLRLDGEKLLELPEFVYRDFEIALPKKEQAQYDEIEKDLFTLLDSGEPISAVSKAAAYNLCKQYTGGQIYIPDPDGCVKRVENRDVEKVHQLKLDCVESIVDELQGKPCMVVFGYRHEATALAQRFRGLQRIDGTVSATKTKRIVDDWNADKISVLAVHPSAMSHGLNMQHGSGRHIIWFSLTDSLENYVQLNRRIRRQGVDSRVFVYRIIAKNTVDRAIALRLENKDQTQNAMLTAIEQYRREKK